jgi:hypothetical protein
VAITSLTFGWWGFLFTAKKEFQICYSPSDRLKSGIPARIETLRDMHTICIALFRKNPIVEKENEKREYNNDRDRRLRGGNGHYF